MNKIVISLLLSIVFALSAFVQEITTPFGTLRVEQPILLELMESQAMQRIKQVKHTGIGYFVHDAYDLTRYDHCIGVWHICALFGASVQEQAAAMLHDASHTAFSHVGDMIFDHKGVDSSHDDIHFGVDVDLWQQLVCSTDAIIVEHIKRYRQYKQKHMVVPSDEPYDYYYKPKCRAVNPLVKTDTGFKRLTDVHDEYAAEYQQLQDVSCRILY